MSDTSLAFMHALAENHGRDVSISLLDGTVHSGEIVGYFKGDGVIGTSYIYKWHLLPKGVENPTDLDFWGVPAGENILHKHIEKVVFLSDGFTLIMK